MAWVFKTRKVKGKTAEAYLTAIRSWLLDNGINWDRKNMPVLQRQLKGFRFLRGDKQDQRCPIGFGNGKLEKFLGAIKKKSIFNRTKRCTFLLMYFGCLRPSEATKSGDSVEKLLRVLRVSNIKWLDGFEATKDIFIHLHSAKNDRLGNYILDIPVMCSCPKLCLVCELRELIIKRANKEGELKGSDYLLVTDSGRPIHYNHVLKWTRCLVKKFKWNTKKYKPYSFRIGRACDLYVGGFSELNIMDFGRWKSASFMRYIRPTASDMLWILKEDKDRFKRLFNVNKKHSALYML